MNTDTDTSSRSGEGGNGAEAGTDGLGRLVTASVAATGPNADRDAGASVTLRLRPVTHRKPTASSSASARPAGRRRLASGPSGSFDGLGFARAGLRPAVSAEELP